MQLDELFRNPSETIAERGKIVDIIRDFRTEQNWNALEDISRLFATFKFRDDREGWLEGIPFSTDTNELNRTLAVISSQGDEMATKRLLRKITELTDGKG